jgi:hypothetical protein
MFDVTTARQVNYGSEKKLIATVFQDRIEKNIWYMVPVPRLRIQDGKPALSLIRYIGNDGKSGGVCTFEVELYAPEDAKQAAQAEIPSIEGWGQFTWISGDAYFDYELTEGGAFKKQGAVQAPSLFGSNVAYFRIELANEGDVKTFVEGLKGPGTTSPFQIAYDMGVLTQLLGAKATIAYRSAVAIDYARKYETKRDTWGNSRTILVETRQILKESGAGDVTVTPGAGSTPELLQLVRDWAWSTLENEVARTVEAALALSEGNTDPVTATSDFTATYSEDAIVEWSTPVSRFLPRFDDATWAELYHEVDNRQLVVVFQLAGDPYGEDGELLYEDVEVTVDYPTRKTDNTFKLIPGTDDFVAKTYVAPGETEFDPTFRYQYKVNFPGGVPPYTSGCITETATQINLRPNLFGIRSVTFYGANVPFGDNGVERVFIDFYDNPPAGQPPKLQTKEMTENGVAVKFATTYHVAITNTYDYRLRYLMADGRVITAQPDQQFGSDNADVVQVLNPAPLLANLVLRALVTANGGGFIEVNANATYFDKQNDPVGRPRNYDWNGWAPGSEQGIYSAETWSFDAQPDTQTAYFRLNGQIVFGNGDIFELTNLDLGYSKKPLILKDTEEVYSVEIFPDQVNWEAVSRVTVNVFQMIDADGHISSAAAQPTAVFLTPLRELTGTASAEVAAKRGPLVPYNILQPAPQAKALPLFYTLRKARAASELVFYFNADYALSDGTIRSIRDTQVIGKLQIHLPSLPADVQAGHIQRIAVATKGL